MRKPRLLAALLLLTVLSTCVISGTFAKYATEGSGSDSARVGKWGVTASVTGGAFAASYAADDEDFTVAVNSVVSSDGETEIVAPGTEGTFTGVALTGTPEVAVRITKTATVAVDNWSDGAAYYCPLYVTVNGTDYYGNDYESGEAFAAALASAIEAANGDYEANTDLSGISGMNGDYSWKWYFTANGEDTKQTNVKDTALGDAATAGTISIDVAVTVEQID